MTEWQFVLYFMAVLHSVGAEDWGGVGTACNDDKIRALVTDRLEKRGIDSHSIKAFIEEMQLQYRANVSNSKACIFRKILGDEIIQVIDDHLRFNVALMSASYDYKYLQFVSLMIHDAPDAPPLIAGINEQVGINEPSSG